jgi:hypothetical protein
MPAGVSAYKALANVTLGSSAASVTFSSISQLYRDLVLVINPVQTSPNTSALWFNADEGTNYSNLRMSGNGSSATSGTTNAFGIKLYSQSAPQAGTLNICQIMDYSATDKHKTVLTRTSDSVYGVEAFVGRWANTAAITSIKIYYPGATWDAGTSMALYGVSA